MDLLAHVDGGIVVSELPRGIGIGGGQRDTVVDVQDLGSAALALDVVRRGDHVLLGVDLPGSPQAAASDGGLGGAGLGGVRAEVVLAEEGAGDAGVELGVSVVGAVDYGEGVAGWVAESQVDLLDVSSVLCTMAESVFDIGPSLFLFSTSSHDRFLFSSLSLQEPLSFILGCIAPRGAMLADGGKIEKNTYHIMGNREVNNREEQDMLTQFFERSLIVVPGPMYVWKPSKPSVTI